MAGGAAAEEGATYSSGLAFVYVFNLVVGFGALTLPSVFYGAGYALASVFMGVLGSVSFATATFVVEAMAAANAVDFLRIDKRHEDHKYELVETAAAAAPTTASASGTSRGERPKRRGRALSYDISSSAEAAGQEASSGEAKGTARVPLDEEEYTRRLEDTPFELRRKFELGDMAKLLLGETAYKVLVAVTAVYLYGDLAIYASATPTTLISLFPGKRDSFEIPGLGLTIEVNREYAYNAWLGLFAMVVVPLSCLNFQKTKHLQIFTCTYRNVALVSMIMLAAIRYERHVSSGRGAVDGDEPDVDLPSFRPEALPKLFGAATYSFMCHHSLPSIIFPIESVARRGVMKILALDYVAILVTYMVLCATAFLAFASYQEFICKETPDTYTCAIQKIYILNFSSGTNPFFGDFLTLLPVFVCFTNFPLIAITTRNNLTPWFDFVRVRVFGGGGETSAISSEKRRLVYSLLVSVPPVIVAFCIHDVSLIVEFTGSYAGLALEFLFPCWLVVAARNRVDALDPKVKDANPFKSPFQSKWAVWIVLLWSFLSLSFIIFQQMFGDDAA
ncbi:Transmembrane protein 104-like [Hondaea fermentalgiana]|uniref:Transmembrane protein 104-like n=1 Tax=Hondaea fermentalgiana TaxID=2315210 RepID=A0A2R5G4N0_9STRA|nr:Transmembrane protein 104-like [Hondaea fermentalgiana]|eukprot:GBG24748.1 Transmembrane protein 104-like [Hondaea fermentalgiana]